MALGRAGFDADGRARGGGPRAVEGDRRCSDIAGLGASVDETLGRWKWYQGGGKCSAAATAKYYFATQELVVDTYAQSTSATRGCTAQVTFTVARFGPLEPIQVNISTACSTSGLSCPRFPDLNEAGRGESFGRQTYSIAINSIESIDVSLLRRDRLRRWLARVRYAPPKSHIRAASPSGIPGCAATP